MDFERRAEKAWERGDPTRAVVVLTEGLKRHPERIDAGWRLAELYVDGCTTPGLERDVAAALAVLSEGAEIAGRIVLELEETDRPAMLRDFRRAADDAGLAIRLPDDTSASGGSVEPPEESPPGNETSADGSMEPTSDETSESVESAESTEFETEPGADREQRARPAPEVDEEESTESRLGRRLVVSAAVLAVCAAAFWGWDLVGSGDSRGRLTEQLRRVDPARPGGIDSFRSAAREKGIAEEVAADGVAWIRAVRALESGRTWDYQGEPVTSWGASARALGALTRGDVRTAVRIRTKIERSSSEGRLVGRWTEARVAEYRGSIRRAADLYEDIVERTPRFVPGLTGAMRMAVVRLDRQALARFGARLRSVRPKHPYLEFRRLEFGGIARSDEARKEGRDGRPSFEAAEDYDAQFLEVVDDYRSARRALDREQFGVALRRASEVLEVRETFGPALWVRGVAAAVRFDVDAADRAFEAVARIPGLGTTYRWYLTVVAPRLLTGAGRPDRGAKYVLPGRGAIRIGAGGAQRDVGEGRGGAHSEDAGPQLRAGESVASLAAKWSFESAEAPVSRRIVEAAHLERLRVALELGRLRLVDRFLEGAPEFRERSREFALFRAEHRARTGHRPAGPTEWDWREASPSERVVDAFYSGRYEKVLEIAETEFDGRRSARLVRMVALSFAATDRGRRALRVVDEAVVPLRAKTALERVRQRILSRLAPRGHAGSETGADIRAIRPTSVEAATDRAAVAIWNRRLEEAGRWSHRAVRRAPMAPGANWIHGLVLRLRGDREGSDSFLRRSWRGYDGSTRLSLELGYVHLAEEHWKRARDAFYSAVLSAPESVEAIRGLGRAYASYNRDRGRNDFSRMLDNYTSNDDRSVHAAEVLRWLAVFDGIREGADAGLEHLERARSLAGDRPVLLLELGRYHEAKQNWKRARSMYIEALERDATLASAHRGLASIAAARDNEPDRRKHLRKYLELQPEGPEAASAREALDELRESASDEEG